MYGLITIIVGGSFAQLLFYTYSTATLFAFLWALRIVKSVRDILISFLNPHRPSPQESTKSTLLVAHFFFLDHAIQSFFHTLFFRHYWYVVPHDGRRTANSQAQLDLINLAASRGEIPQPNEHQTEGADDLRAALAGEIWRAEKPFAIWVLVFGFFIKVRLPFISWHYG